ncbi:uncharacterized protein BO87DRAFT_45825 [Aspergillus neoniger CBS 115656]|uniref:Uncharacterized protein n=1 Tax=Aspergillus neoniger (strain CBS 115656) TaxID=1448310 RepID=A0A318YSA0_ASPNB|nr:hypothetical protein BO87DRAFT_45825 [Aspergillus neoniger CBS 115656]PYH34930.1 hypothetical protein BO87DRAFT_45825 [Aspergillus neoniger CBS 115656]
MLITFLRSKLRKKKIPFARLFEPNQAMRFSLSFSLDDPCLELFLLSCQPVEQAAALVLPVSPRTGAIPTSIQEPPTLKRRRQSRPCGGPNLDGIMPFAEEAGVRGGNYDARRTTADRQLSLATLTGHFTLCYLSSV